MRGMMWANNYWLFCDNKERLVCMVNDIIEELLDLDMEPSQNRCGGQALAKTRTRQHFKWGAKGKLGTYPSVKCSISWATVFTVMGRGFKAPNGLSVKVWAVGGGTGTFIAQRVCPC